MSYLRANGVHVDVVCVEDERSRIAAEREGVRLISLTIKSTLAPLDDLRMAVRLAQIVQSGQYDVVCVSTKKAALVAAIACKLVSAKCLYVVRGLARTSVGAFRSALFNTIERIIAKLSDCVLVLSQSNAEYFRRAKLCKPSKLTLIGRGSLNGIDLQRFRSSGDAFDEGRLLRASLGVPEHAFVVGFVGRLAAAKGIADLQLVWSMLCVRYPSVHLLIASPPEIEPGAMPPVDKLTTAPRVHFAGFRSNTRAVYQAMNCLILPSYGEGFGMVIIEAGAMAVPCIAYDVRGVRDVILNGETGLLVPAHSVVALSQAIEWMITDPDRCRSYGEAARSYVMAEFRREAVWIGIEALMRKLSNAGSAEIAA
jgi:glycosyltransferase involved in cell wall biosynthesis